jgi:hypothetical protein
MAGATRSCTHWQVLDAISELAPPGPAVLIRHRAGHGPEGRAQPDQRQVAFTLSRRKERAMTIHQGLMKAGQDDAKRAGERDRLLLEARRARTPHRQRARSAAPARRIARLLFRRATAQGSGY